MLPIRKIFFLPTISDILPKGTRKIADASKNDICIQLKDMAVNENSLLITGSATFTADPMKGLKNDDIIATANRTVLLTW